MAGLLLFVAAVLGIGWYVDNVVRAQDVVATVDGEAITTGQRADELRPSAQLVDSQARRLAASSTGRNPQLTQYIEQQKRQLPDQILSSIIQERLVSHEAARRGISIPPAEVDERLRKEVSEQELAKQPPLTTAAVEPSPQPSPAASVVASSSPVAGTPTPFPSPTAVPTLAPDPFRDALARQLGEYGISEARYRQLLSRDVLRDKLSDAFAAEVPATQEQVHARHILLATEEEAQKALQRLTEGADFAQLAQELSTDPGSKEKGGDLGWASRGMYNEPFENAVFNLQPGQRSGIVRSPNGYHIIELIERDPNRPIEPAALESLKQSAFPKWLQDKRSGSAAQMDFSAAERDWALRQMGVRP